MEASPKRGILVRTGSVFSKVFNQCLLERCKEFIFQLQTLHTKTRNVKLIPYQNCGYTLRFLTIDRDPDAAR